jgi:hypothetical protein
MNDTNTISTKRSALPLIAAWLIVTIPAGWGVSQTIHKSLALFTSAPPPTVAPAPASDQSSRH